MTVAAGVARAAHDRTLDLRDALGTQVDLSELAAVVNAKLDVSLERGQAVFEAGAPVFGVATRDRRRR
jgi:hypothetical protein